MTKKFAPIYKHIEDRKKVLRNFSTIFISLLLIFLFIVVFFLVSNFFNTQLTSKQDYLGSSTATCAYLCNEIRDTLPQDVNKLSSSSFCTHTFTYVLTKSGKFEEKTKYPVSKWRVFNCWDWPINYNCNLDKLAKNARDFC